MDRQMDTHAEGRKKGNGRQVGSLQTRDKKTGRKTKTQACRHINCG